MYARYTRDTGAGRCACIRNLSVAFLFPINLFKCIDKLHGKWVKLEVKLFSCFHHFLLKCFLLFYIKISFHGTVASQITCLSVFSGAILYNRYTFSNWNWTDECEIESTQSTMTPEVPISSFCQRNTVLFD